MPEITPSRYRVDAGWRDVPHNGSGLWAAANPPLTLDGVHETRDGYIRIRESTPAPTSQFQP